MTLDALLALVLVMTVFLVVLGVRNSVKNIEKTEFMEIHYLSEDVLEVLNKKGVLDQICSEWALSGNNQSSGHWSNARYVASRYLPRMVPERMGYALYIDGTELFNDSGRMDRESAHTRTHSTRILTGYQPGLPVRAYAAALRLTGITGKQDASYAFFGGYVGEGNITQKLELPPDSNPSAAYMELVAGGNFSLYVNGEHCGSYVTSGPGESVNVKEDIGCYLLFSAGVNNLSIMFNATENNSIGGGYLKVVYETSGLDTAPDSGFYSFPGINGTIDLHSSLYVPGNLYSMEIYLHYKSDAPVYLTLGNATIFYEAAAGEQSHTINSATILSNLSDAGLAYADLSDRAVPVRLGAEGVARDASSQAALGMFDQTLYPDSYVRLYFDPSTQTTQYGEVSLNLESAEFGNTISAGSFYLPNGSSLVEARVTSYSGPYWTKYVGVLNVSGEWQEAYSIDAWGTNYTRIGDPFPVQIPLSLIRRELNNVSVSVGNSAENVSGTPENKVIYTVLMPLSVSMGAPMETSEGCNWTVEFYDHTTAVVSTPSGYSGIEECSYANGSISYDNRSAVNDAAYRLFRQFDVSPRDGRLDVIFDEGDVETESTIIGGVGSLWGPAEVELVIWMK